MEDRTEPEEARLIQDRESMPSPWTQGHRSLGNSLLKRNAAFVDAFDRSPFLSQRPRPESPAAMADACELVTPIGQNIEAHRMYYLAPISLATSLDNALFGVLCVAVWTYFSTFKKDRKVFKVLVGSLFALNIAQTVSAIAFSIQTFTVLAESGGIFSRAYVIAIQTVETLVICLAQSFFLERVYKLSKSLVLAILLIPLVVAGVASGLAIAILIGVLQGSSNPDAVDFTAMHVLTSVTKGWKAATFATDLLLTCSMIYLLQSNRNGRHRTNRLGFSLIFLTCEAQLLSCLASLYFLVAYFYDPGGSAWLLGSKVASLSVLIVLNSRTQLRHELSLPQPSDLSSIRDRQLISLPSFLPYSLRLKPKGLTGLPSLAEGTSETRAQARIRIEKPLGLFERIVVRAREGEVGASKI